MQPIAYYNEIDPFAAQWLRELIKAGHIAPGYVDQRSIEDVQPDELRHFTQCHFFAGIGVWSYALRQAGWPDDRPVWTGSCPCQPFSAAGKGGGFDDERHLWPAFHWLIEQCRPPVVFGEQVASAAAGPWLDLVQADLEALDYAFGCVAFPSASVGAPHIRDRAYWVADSGNQRHEWGAGAGRQAQRRAEHAGSVSGMADSNGSRPLPSALPRVHRGEEGAGARNGEPERLGADGSEHSGPVNGFWRNADWLGCRDGKYRPVEPGTFPLANGTPARVGRLRGYGNAINAEAAKAFIEAYMS